MSKDKQVGKKAVAPTSDVEQESPKGALAITVIYLITIVILWSWMYLTLLERGITQ